jgi:Tfp pilus assembly protein FimT
MHCPSYYRGYLCWELVIVFALCACMLTLSSPYYQHWVARTTTLQNEITRLGTLS